MPEKLTATSLPIMTPDERFTLREFFKKGPNFVSSGYMGEDLSWKPKVIGYFAFMASISSLKKLGFIEIVDITPNDPGKDYGGSYTYKLTEEGIASAKIVLFKAEAIKLMESLGIIQTLEEKIGNA